MSFAVSAVIAPSRRLRWLVVAFCALLFATAAVVGLVVPGRFAGGGLLAVLPLCAALSLAVRSRPWSSSRANFPRTGTRRRIDVSGPGQIRLTVQQTMQAGSAHATLLPGATVWPACIVLRLRTDDGAIHPLVLLPDALSAGQYRALAVAVRALAQRDAKSSSKKIG